MKKEETPGLHKGCAISKGNSWQGQNDNIRGSCQPLGRREKHSALQEQGLQRDTQGGASEDTWNKGVLGFSGAFSVL